MNNPHAGTAERLAASGESARTAAAVSIIIPAFNEEGAIAAQIAALTGVMDRSGRLYELIVVDDGSTDGTAEQARRHPVRLIQFPANRGYGTALKAGIAAAEHEWILITDADGTYPVDAIPEMLARAGDYDMVVGARVGERVEIPLPRRPAKWFLGKMASYLAEQPIPDLNSGLRVIRRSLVEQYEHLLPSGFSFTTTITMALLANNYRVFYYPIDYHKRVGKSKLRSRAAYDFLLLILRTVVYFNPLRVFLPLGAIFFLAGMVKFIYDAAQWNLSDSAVMLILSAVILWAVGLLADQISRVGLALKSK